MARVSRCIAVHRHRSGGHLLAAVCTIACVAAAGMASGASVRVAPLASGADDAGCVAAPSTTPCVTLAAALTAVGDGDDVIVEPDTYTPDAESLALAGHNVSCAIVAAQGIVSAAGASPACLLDCAGSAGAPVFVASAPTISPSVIRGFGISNCPGRALDASGGAVVEVVDSAITACGESAADGGAVIVTASANATMRRVSVTGSSGRRGGGAFVDTGASLYLDSCLLSGNSAADVGGSVAVVGGASMSLSAGTRVFDSEAVNLGGGIHVSGGTLAMNCTAHAACAVSGNTAPSGGGLDLRSGGQASAIFTTFGTNTATGAGGGAVHVDAAALLVGDGVAMSANNASTDGGAVFMTEGATMTVDCDVSNPCELVGNQGGFGGAVFATSGSSVTLAGAVQLRSNTANRHGGGLSIDDGGSLALLPGVVVSNNTANAGGGIYLHAPTSFTAACSAERQCEITHNIALANGGGVFMEFGDDVAFEHVAFRDNVAVTSGGGVFAHYVPLLAVVQSNVTGNGAGIGGGIYAQGTQLRFTDVRVADNTAVQSAGGVLCHSASFETSGGAWTGNVAPLGGGLAAHECEVAFDDVVMADNAASHTAGGCAYIAGESSFLLRNVTMLRCTSAAAGGGVFVESESSATVTDDSTFVECTAGADGGAIAAADECTVTLDHATLHDCYATDSGGALHLDISNLVVRDATIDGAGALEGAAVYASYGRADLERLTMANNSARFGAAMMLVDVEGYCADCVLTGNAAESGGALVVRELADFELRGGTFANNTATADGGVVRLLEDSSLVISGAALRGNSAGAYGGVLSVEGHNCEVTIASVTAHGNRAATGGVVHASQGARVHISGSDFVDGVAYNSGGAVSAESSASVELRSVTLARNNATVSGGGVFADADASLTLVNCTLEVSFAGVGGCVAVADGTLVVNATRFTWCRAAASGGAISIAGVTDAAVWDSKVRACYAGGSGGAISSSGAAGRLVVGSTGFDGCRSRDCGGAVAATTGVHSHVLNASFTGCSAGTDGGGVCAFGGASLTVDSGSVFAGCNATANGGSVFAGDLTVVSLNDVAVVRSSAGDRGGGVALEGAASAALTSVRLSHGQASMGGALYADDVPSVTVIGVVMDDNVATCRGGGGLACDGATVIAAGSTSKVVGNRAPYSIYQDIFCHSGSACLVEPADVLSFDDFNTAIGLNTWCTLSKTAPTFARAPQPTSGGPGGSELDMATLDQECCGDVEFPCATIGAAIDHSDGQGTIGLLDSPWDFHESVVVPVGVELAVVGEGRAVWRAANVPPADDGGGGSDDPSPQPLLTVHGTARLRNVTMVGAADLLPSAGPQDVHGEHVWEAASPQRGGIVRCVGDDGGVTSEDSEQVLPGAPLTATLEVFNCTLRNAAAVDSGGLVSADACAVRIDRSELQHGAALTGRGGCVDAENSAVVVITDSEVAMCNATVAGGAVAAHRSAKAVLRRVQLSQSYAGEFGGAVSAEEGDIEATGPPSVVEIDDCSVVDSGAAAGGLLGAGRGRLSVTRSTLARGRAFSGAGGCVAARNGAAMNVTDSALEGCHSAAGGGAVSAASGSRVDIIGGELTQSFSLEAGGAISVDGFETHVSLSGGCSLRDNTAVFLGGSMSVTDGGYVTASHTSVSRSHALYGGGVGVNLGTAALGPAFSISDCTASESGGGLLNSGAKIDAVDTAITNCRARRGGGAAVFAVEPADLDPRNTVQSGRLGLLDSVVRGCIAVGSAADAGGRTQPTVEDTEGGGGIYVFISEKSVSVVPEAFARDPYATDEGLGVHELVGVFVNVTNTTLVDNTAARGMGGGVLCVAASGGFNATDSHFKSNAAETGGAGLAALENCEVEIRGGSFVNGTTGGIGGGGVLVTGAAATTLVGTALRHNRATQGDGGGLYANVEPDAPPSRIDSCDVHNNSAKGRGGGLYLETPHPAEAKGHQVHHTGTALAPVDLEGVEVAWQGNCAPLGPDVFWLGAPPASLVNGSGSLSHQHPVDLRLASGPSSIGVCTLPRATVGEFSCLSAEDVASARAVLSPGGASVSLFVDDGVHNDAEAGAAIAVVLLDAYGAPTLPVSGVIASASFPTEHSDAIVIMRNPTANFFLVADDVEDATWGSSEVADVGVGSSPYSQDCHVRATREAAAFDGIVVDAPPGFQSTMFVSLITAVDDSDGSCSSIDHDEAEIDMSVTPLALPLLVTECPAGFEVGNGRCVPCDAGAYSPNDRVGCLPCEPGSFSHQAGAVACELCEINTFAAETGALSCDDCPDHMVTKVRGRAHCVADRGFYVLTTGHDVHPCPTGALCPDIGTTPRTLETREGFWRASEVSNIMRVCPQEGACEGSELVNGTMMPLCRYHHTGPLCTLCNPGTYHNGQEQECLKCPENAEAEFVFWACFNLAIICTIVYTFRFVRRRGRATAIEAEVEAAEAARRREVDGYLQGGRRKSRAPSVDHDWDVPERDPLAPDLRGPPDAAAVAAGRARAPTASFRFHASREGSLAARSTDAVAGGAQQPPPAQVHVIDAARPRLETAAGANARRLGDGGTFKPGKSDRIGSVDRRARYVARRMWGVSVMYRILATFFQLTLQTIEELQAVFPGMWTKWMSYFVFVSLDLPAYIDLHECMYTYDSYGSMAFLTSFTMGAVAVAFAVVATCQSDFCRLRYRRVTRRRSVRAFERHRAASAASSRTGSVAGAGAGGSDEKVGGDELVPRRGWHDTRHWCLPWRSCTQKEGRPFWRGQVFGSLLFLTFTVLPSVSSRIFSVLRPCEELDTLPRATSFVAGHYDLPCDDPAHRFYVYWAIVCFFIFPFGLPLLYLVVLFRGRKALNPTLEEVRLDQSVIRHLDGEVAVAALGVSSPASAPLSPRSDSVASPPHVVQRTADGGIVIVDGDTGHFHFWPECVRGRCTRLGKELRLFRQPGISEEEAAEARDDDPSVSHAGFLFHGLRPSQWHFEVLQQLVKVTQTGYVLLLPNDGTRQVVSLLVSFLWMLYGVISKPFLDGQHNAVFALSQVGLFVQQLFSVTVFASATSNDGVETHSTQVHLVSVPVAFIAVVIPALLILRAFIAVVVDLLLFPWQKAVHRTGSYCSRETCRECGRFALLGYAVTMFLTRKGAFGDDDDQSHNHKRDPDEAGARAGSSNRKQRGAKSPAAQRPPRKHSAANIVAGIETVEMATIHRGAAPSSTTSGGDPPTGSGATADARAGKQSSHLKASSRMMSFRNPLAAATAAAQALRGAATGAGNGGAVVTSVPDASAVTQSGPGALGHARGRRGRSGSGGGGGPSEGSGSGNGPGGGNGGAVPRTRERRASSSARRSRVASMRIVNGAAGGNKV